MEEQKKKHFISNEALVDIFKRGPLQRMAIYKLLGYKTYLTQLPFEVASTCLEYLATKSDDNIKKFLLFAETYFLDKNIDKVERELAIENAYNMFKEMYALLSTQNNNINQQKKLG